MSKTGGDQFLSGQDYDRATTKHGPVVCIILSNLIYHSIQYKLIF